MTARRAPSRLSIALHEVGVRRAEKWVLRDISWQLEAGERWALLGDNGAGKTQLLKTLSGAVWPTPVGHEPGAPRQAARSYRRGAAELTLIEAKPHMAYIGAESQDKYARYGWDLLVHELVATGLHGTDLVLHPITAQDVAQVAKVLRRCGLQRYAQRRFLSLSYGEKRLALLARALVQDPDWLLLDEFYNGLDRDYRRRIDTILEAARRRGQSWVATAHRAADVPRGTGLALQLAAGRVQSVGRLTRAHVQQLALRAAETQQPPVTRAPAGAPSQTAFIPRCIGVAAIDRCGSLRGIPSGAQAAELAAAPRRALGGVRRQRRRQIEFLEAALR